MWWKHVPSSERVLVDMFTFAVRRVCQCLLNSQIPFRGSLSPPSKCPEVYALDGTLARRYFKCLSLVFVLVNVAFSSEINYRIILELRFDRIMEYFESSGERDLSSSDTALWATVTVFLSSGPHSRSVWFPLPCRGGSEAARFRSRLSESAKIRNQTRPNCSSRHL